MPGEWPKENLITVEFQEENGNTNMKLTHTGIPTEMADDCVKGWQQCFDKLEKN